ncbi:plasmid mobilization relaxosome protein MobC [Aliarcobacter butzleri]|uniref:plasmid mobilization relaxosome protein MobC n=1 Tax=Aliarcobacter butzleri TaxID=28197 RepID=UPI0021B30284|nr:plasmid mobilization relaxosome protein MobC [Aliarcobacter butzleri]MCT7616468.1 plasmid mobilization relaxosome protein MobC [Aliarcobacter butzleri]
MNNINLKLKPLIYEQLKALRNEYKMPITTIINIILAEKLQDELDNIRKIEAMHIAVMMKNQKLNEYGTDAEKEIRFRVTNQERDYLITQAKLTGTGNLTSEIRYRLLKSIYRNPFFNPIELQEIRNISFQIRKIGLNINQVSKKANFGAELNKGDFTSLKYNIDEVSKQMGLLLKELKKSLKFHNLRIS